MLVIGNKLFDLIDEVGVKVEETGSISTCYAPAEETIFINEVDLESAYFLEGIDDRYVVDVAVLHELGHHFQKQDDIENVHRLRTVDPLTYWITVLEMEEDAWNNAEVLIDEFDLDVDKPTFDRLRRFFLAGYRQSAYLADMLSYF